MNLLRKLWAEGQTGIGGWMQISDALTAEVMSHSGYDAVVIDMQHSGTTFDNATSMIRAIELGGALPFVRTRANKADEIGHLLDFGALGIIVPMIESADQARALARAVHYPPHGDRSFGPRRPSLRFGADYPAKASETFVTFAMIETRKGLENIDEILAVEGLDGVFIGPADLSQSLTGVPRPDSDDPVVVDAVRRVREKAHAAGRRAGIFCGGVEFARSKKAEGFDFVTLTPDLSMLAAAARAAVSRARED